MNTNQELCAACSKSIENSRRSLGVILCSSCEQKWNLKASEVLQNSLTKWLVKNIGV